MDFFIPSAFTTIFAIPLFTHAAKDGPSHDYKAMGTVLSQECVKAMAVVDDATLATVDDEAKAKKDARTARSAAFTVAATIKDDTKRADAVKKAKQAYAVSTHLMSSDALKEAMQAHRHRGARIRHGNTMKSSSHSPKDGDHCTVIVGVHQGKSGTVADSHMSKTGHLTITVVQANGERFKTLAKNVA